MTIGELVAYLRARGIAVSVRDGELNLSGDFTVDTAPYWIEAAQRKDEIFDLLCPNAHKVLH